MYDYSGLNTTVCDATEIACGDACPSVKCPQYDILVFDYHDISAFFLSLRFTMKEDFTPTDTE